MIAKVYDKAGQFTGVTAKVENVRDCLAVVRGADLTTENLVIAQVCQKTGDMQLFNRLGKAAFTFKKVG